MVHPVQSVIESLYAAGRCPRLHVNAMFAGVVCPDFIRDQWRERLIIDLDPSYPLELTFQSEGLAADLSFGGYMTRCTFPYGAVYVVSDRSTGRGIVLDQNMPESVRQSRYAKPGAPPPPGKPTSGTATTTGPHPSPNTPPPAGTTTGRLRSVDTEPAEAQAAAPPAAPATGPGADEGQVQRRRAAFKVIDGGG